MKIRIPSINNQDDSWKVRPFPKFTLETSNRKKILVDFLNHLRAPLKTKMTLENLPFEDAFPIKNCHLKKFTTKMTLVISIFNRRFFSDFLCLMALRSEQNEQGMEGLALRFF